MCELGDGEPGGPGGVGEEQVGDALLARTEFGAQGGRRTVGFITDGDVPAAGTPVTAGTETVGEVVHAVESYGTGRVLGLARLNRDLAAAGLVLDVADAPAETVTSPYVTPKSWSIPIV